MRIAGIVVFVFGFLICLSIVGIPFGIFLMIVGVLMMIFGGRSKTIITNVVQVSNAPGQSYARRPRLPLTCLRSSRFPRESHRRSRLPSILPRAESLSINRV